MKKIAIVGATGLVGKAFIDLMESRSFQFESIHLFASQRSEGTQIRVKDRDWPIQTLKASCFKGIDLAFFSAGSGVSKKWAPQAVKEGCRVIDNSSAFRMDADIPLIVPEVNGSVLTPENKLISNPNCSTIQLCVALNPIHQSFQLKRVFVATYQSLSGAGGAASQRLKEETSKALKTGESNPHSFNCIPQIGDIGEDGFSLEDRKVQNETQRILQDTNICLSAFSVRVPTLTGHGEVVWMQLAKPPKNREAFIKALKTQKGLVIMEGLDQYPTNETSSGKDLVYVGRIHQDSHDPSTWLMWVMADNLRKGAALNGIQIAELLTKDEM